MKLHRESDVAWVCKCPCGPDQDDLTLRVCWSDVVQKSAFRIGNAHRIDGQRRRAWEFRALDRCVMLNLIRCSSIMCQSDNIGRSTRKRQLFLRATYRRYNECTLEPRASKRFPMWIVHPPDQKSAWMPALSNCPMEMGDCVRSGMCRTS